MLLPRFVVDEVRRLVEGRPADALVFTTPGGSMLRVQNWRRDGFNAATVTVGVPGLTPHELCHTAASLAIRSGASIKVVQAMLGHKSATVTLTGTGTCCLTTWTGWLSGWMRTGTCLRTRCGLDLSREAKPSAPERIRTFDSRFRKPLLYPLSYGGGRDTARCTRLPESDLDPN